jgi:molybdopterin synthase catalytic subunit/molybdopterin converting factor small subunit
LNFGLHRARAGFGSFTWLDRARYGFRAPASKQAGILLKKMRVQLLPFGVLKDVLRPAPLDLPAAATVGDLLVELGARLGDQPALTALLPRIAVSVNAEYAQSGQVLREGDQVGLLPPVSGGRGAAAEAVITFLTREAIRSEELVAAAKLGSDGAVVVFDGIVRNNTRGRQTLHLDYEAYEEMAAKQMAELAAQAVERFGVRGVTLVHRLGRLQIGETSVLIVVASAHRGAAFEASRWLIDTLKKTVPIWKKETFVDGAVWADGEPFPPELVASPQIEPVVATSERQS